MKFNRTIFIIVTLIVSIVLMLNLISCDYLIKNKKTENNRKEIVKEEVTKDKHEAKLLVEASKYNLDIIQICNIIENKEEKVDDTIVDVVEEVKEEQLELLDRYKDLATENIISLPTYSSIAQDIDVELENDEDLKVYLNLMNRKIYTQKSLLDKLSDTTNNISFKKLVVEAKKTLKKSLKMTNQTLEKLKADI